jgi:hypothetical protein
MVGSRFVKEVDSYHLTVGAGILRDQLNIILKYNENVFEQETVQAFGDRYMQVLRVVLGSVEQIGAKNG